MRRPLLSLVATLAIGGACAGPAMAQDAPPACPGKSIFIVATNGDGASGFGLRVTGISCNAGRTVARKFVRCRASKGKGGYRKPAGYKATRSKTETFLRKGDITIRFYVTAGDEPTSGSAKPPNCR